MEKKKVIVADASEEFRRLLVETLRGEGDLSVVGETGDGEAAVELCRQRQCRQHRNGTGRVCGAGHEYCAESQD